MFISITSFWFFTMSCDTCVYRCTVFLQPSWYDTFFVIFDPEPELVTEKVSPQHPTHSSEKLFVQLLLSDFCFKVYLLLFMLLFNAMIYSMYATPVDVNSITSLLFITELKKCTPSVVKKSFTSVFLSHISDINLTISTHYL